MLAPVKVLHLPDPKGLAIERLGEARAEELLREGADTPVEQVIADVLAAPGPSTWPDLPDMAMTRTAGTAGTESGRT